MARNMEEHPKKDRSILNIFMILILSLILIASGYIESWITRIFIEVLAFILQAVIVTNIVRNYYELLN